MKKQSKMITGITAGVLFVAVIVIVAVLMASGSDSKKYARHMESAQRYIDELDYEQAVAEYKAAIEIEPNNVEAYCALAELYVQTGDYESAIEILSQGIERTDSEELAEYIEKVRETYEGQKALAEASAQEKETVVEESQEMEVQELPEETDEDRYSDYLEQAQELIDERNYEQAIEVYETAIALMSEREEAYLALAELYVLMEDYESALEVLNRGIEETESGELAEYLEEVQSAWEEKQEALQEATKEDMLDLGVIEEETTVTLTPGSASEQSITPNFEPTQDPLIFPQMQAMLPSETIKFSLPEENSEKIVIFESTGDCSAVEISIFNEENSFDANISYYVGYIHADGTVETVGEIGVSLYASNAFDKNCTNTFYLEKAGEYGIYVRNAVSYNPHYYSGTNVNELQMTYRVISADSNEPNSTIETATKLEDGRYCFFNLLGNGDTDYFVIGLTENYDKIEISIASETGRFDSPIVYTVEKYDEASGNMISVGSMWGAYASNAKQNNVTKTYEIAGAGIYYIKVTNASNANSLYYHGDNKAYMAIMCRGITEESAH